MYKTRLAIALIITCLFAGCGNPNVQELASNSEVGNVGNFPPAQITAASIEPSVHSFLEYNEVELTSSIEQIHYVMPVTLDDIVEEGSIIIEGLMGEMVSRADVKSCYNTFNQESAPREKQVSEEFMETIEAYWFQRLEENETAIEAIEHGKRVFEACESARNSCPGSCEVYAAIGSTAAGPRGLKHLTEFSDQ